MLQKVETESQKTVFVNKHFLEIYHLNFLHLTTEYIIHMKTTQIYHLLIKMNQETFH